MQLDKVKEIIDLMTANGLAEFEMEENGVRLSIKKGGVATVVQTVDALVPTVPLTAPAPAAPVADDPRVAVVNAPFVGTLYRAPFAGCRVVRDDWSRGVAGDGLVHC